MPDHDGKHCFDTGAVRSNDVDHLRFDLISPVGLRRLSARYALGAKKYGDHNYLKGMPMSNVFNHLVAHANKFRAGDRSDDNLAAIAWGAFTLMHFEETRPDLDDMTNSPLSYLATTSAYPTLKELFPHNDDLDQEPQHAPRSR